MGCECNPLYDIKYSELQTYKYRELGKPFLPLFILFFFVIKVSHIEQNKNLMKLIVLIQSYFRGMIFRKKFALFKNNSKKNTHDLKSKPITPSKINKPFKSKTASIKKEKKPINSFFKTPQNNIPPPEGTLFISDNELEKVFKRFPPLKDKIKVFKEKPTKIENGAIYYGEWAGGGKIRHGRGIQKWPNGSVYEGVWKNDKFNAKGKLSLANGDVYEGDFLDNKAFGYGTYYYADGTVYEGNFREDLKDGFGKEIWTDGASYDGFFKEGKKNGVGKFKWSDGTTYEGNFLNNNIHGKGVFIWPDRRQYVGEWKDNKLDGKGIFTWPNGVRYNGEYENDKKHGKGLYDWGDGKKYDGYWDMGYQDGEGKFFHDIHKKWRKCSIDHGKSLKWLDEENEY